jgi:hypothetical protein
MAPVIESLPGKHETFNSNPNTTKNKSFPLTYITGVCSGACCEAVLLHSIWPWVTCSWQPEAPLWEVSNPTQQRSGQARNLMPGRT